MNTIQQKLKEYLKLKGYAKKTQKAYFSALRCFEDYYHKSPKQLGNIEVRNFLLHLIRINRASSTLRIYYSALSVVYKNILNQPEVMLNIPMFKKDKKRLPVILSREEINKILSVTTNKKHRAMIAVAYSSGLRVSEVVNLTVKDIDSDRLMLNIRKTKGGYDRSTILSKKTLHILREYYAIYRPNNFLFQGKKNNLFADVQLTTRTIQRVFHQAKIAAGITKDVSFHSLRHSFATHLIEDGVNILFVQRLLGHALLKTTLIYLHTTSQSLSGINSPFDNF
ncbi:MAG: integrase [Candidatus Margulisiibacteriota bacterium]|nr:MAG: hypothetical protein A2X11_00015 [Bacteroidetes bacterium GWE2_42_24]PZM81927.1 MAG: integrase [Candidatus Margulisiibacteriota bacterium]HCT84614.1 integrase [Candidatus Margulisiibacteriota bacterium]